MLQLLVPATETSCSAGELMKDTRRPPVGECEAVRLELRAQEGQRGVSEFWDG